MSNLIKRLPDTLFNMTEYRLHMRLHRTVIFATTALLTLFSAVAGGQQQTVPNAAILETEAEEIRRYSVEMIVFQYVGEAAGSVEIFQPEEQIVPDETPDDGTLTGDLSPRLEGGQVMLESDPLAPAQAPEDESPAEGTGLEEIDLLAQELEEIVTYEQSGHIRLGPEEFVLTDIYEKLVRLDAYQPLMHTAWVQPTVEKDASTTLKLRRIGDPPLRLNGTVTLYLSRFLHLVLDLALEEKSPQRMTSSQESVRYYGDDQSRTAFSFDPQFITPSTFYRIQEDRIVRNGELRYYDHPKFGVIAKITRVEEEEPRVEPDTTNDLMPGGIN
jgi:hypothetical protein